MCTKNKKLKQYKNGKIITKNNPFCFYGFVALWFPHVRLNYKQSFPCEPHMEWDDISFNNHLNEILYL